ncbi:hypothetical protein [Aeromonas enteropelogenes]|uniref:hypothetical protein n=1 Tax=Aeromonas enteropelogenes TaxID=29489 RepID=UPI000F532694|nr:hypothetical protein [Aeromonas enteropelogenes]RQM57813.1 hypothetical protein EHZ64_20355 [Aeromonas enteropelogenes]
MRTTNCANCAIGCTTLRTFRDERQQQNHSNGIGLQVVAIHHAIFHFQRIAISCCQPHHTGVCPAISREFSPDPDFFMLDGGYTNTSTRTNFRQYEERPKGFQ